jgi:hypothetical protein
MAGLQERREVQAGAGQEPAEEAGRYCIRLSRVLTRAVSCARLRLARLASDRLRCDQTSSLPRTQAQPPPSGDHEMLTGLAGAADGPLPRQPHHKHLKGPGVAGNLRPVHSFDPPGAERARNDVLVDVIAYPCSPKRRPEQELAARPKNTAQLRRIARTVLGGEVVKAATVNAGIDRRRPQRRSQQAGPHISRARVAGGGGGQGHRRQIQAGDAPPEPMKMYRFASEPAADIKCTTR